MNPQLLQPIELLPDTGQAQQLFIFLHGVGTVASDLLPLAHQFRQTFPQAAFVLLPGIRPFSGNPNRREWFSINGVTEDNRYERVSEVLPNLHDLVSAAQNRFGILQSDTALLGFSQGAIVAMEFGIKHDGHVGRILAFSGRFARLPNAAPQLTTLHMFHGENDSVISVTHAQQAFNRLLELNGDATLDVDAASGHGISPALIECSLHRLQTCIPMRTWKRVMEST
ncbi:MAG: esterase [Gallionella sp.]